MVAKLLKIPVVMTFHTFYFDADILKAVRFGRVFGLFKSPLERLNAYFHNFADVVICPSLSAQQELTREGLTTPSVIINNSIDASSVRRFTKKEKVARRRELNLPAQGPVGIFTGRMAADKRVDVLLQCWAKVCARYPSAHLVLIGNGPEEAKLRQLAQTLRLKTNVLFLGKMTRAAIFEAGWYAVADVFVSASRIENQSMSMIEAMVSGLPIIAVNMRGVAELVDSRNGIVTTRSSAAALARAVLYALDNPKERERLAEGSLVRAQQHTTPVTVSQLEALYHRLIHVATHTI